jgi:REP element-mobilizing transposase RayT
MASSFGTRKPNRAPGFDYRSPGPYFVTLCVQDRGCLFGAIVDDSIRHSDAGKMITAAWLTLSHRFEIVQFDESVVMPNHFHALLALPSDSVNSVELGAILQAFKRLTTNLYINGVNDQGWPRFDDRLWQRSFHDHIVRNEREMELIREYISSNPARWSEDRLFAGS